MSHEVYIKHYKSLYKSIRVRKAYCFISLAVDIEIC